MKTPKKSTHNSLSHMDKKSKLIYRLENNYDDFLQSISGVSRQMLINMARRIAAYSEVYIYFAKEYEWDDEQELGFYLLFKDPLTIMVDTWLDYRDCMTVDMSGILSSLNYDTTIAEYPLKEGVQAYMFGLSESNI